MAFAYFILFLIYIPNNVISSLDSLHRWIPEIPSFLGISVAMSIFSFLAAGPFELGFAGYFIKRIRGEEIFTRNIFDGFKRFFPGFLLIFLIFIFTFLWSLLLIIPGIIKYYGYSMAFYIMYDNPDIKPLEAIKRSKIMMKGYKWKYFLLELSFIGWGLLTVLTLFIGTLWLNPYISLSKTNFYENLKKNQEKLHQEKIPGKLSMDEKLFEASKPRVIIG
ncbi:MAG: DUF975 family protein [Treponema sp.]|nr:DUF975 family protein [Treponema sp.]